MEARLQKVFASLKAAMGRKAAAADPAGAMRSSRPQAHGTLSTSSSYSDSTPFGNATTGYRTRSSSSLLELRDAQPVQRREAMRNSRFLAAKLGIIKALHQNTTRYSIGRGLMPSSGCRDEEWAQMADELFYEWASRKSYDIRAEMTHFEAQKIILPDVIRDGDAGAVPVRNFFGEPAVQHFPSDIIGDSAGESIFKTNPGWRWREGILRNSIGAPVAFRVLRDWRDRQSDPQARAYWDYPAQNFWHVGRNQTMHANRPLPWIHHGDQSAIQILDLNVLEMQAAKLNSYFAAAIKVTENGMPAGIADLLTKETESIQTGRDAEGNAVTSQVERSYLNLMGGAGIPVLEPGEELQFFKNERPSTTFAGFIEYLIADIAIGFGVPVQFAWGLTGLAGPHARLVLQQADWFFQDVADVLVTNYCQPVWESFIADQMNRGLLRPPTPGTNWRSVQWQGPGSMTIDKGRDGKLYLEMVAVGLGRRTAWHEMTGKHGKTELMKTVKEVRYIMDLCDESGVPYEYVLGKQAANAGSATDPMAVAEEIASRMESA
jgi:capsid protein